MKFKIKPWHLNTIIFVIMCVLLYRTAYLNLYDVLLKTEYQLEDACFQKPGNIDEKIKMIVIDDESLKRIGAWPWKRSVHAKLLNILAKGKPAAVGMDVLFTENSGSPSDDKALADAAKKTGCFVAASYGDLPVSSKAGYIKADNYAEPFGELKDVSASGHINVIPDSDGRVRRSLNYFKFNDKIIQSFDIAIYKQYMKSIGKPADLSKMSMDDFKRSYISFTEHASSFTPIPYYMVLNGSYDPDYFKDSIVLIGPYTVGTNDFYQTSMDRNTQMFGVEIHANILENLIHNNFKKSVPIFVNYFVLIAAFIIAVIDSRRFSPVRSAIIAAALAAAYYFGAYYVFKKGYMLILLYPIAFAAVNYIVILAYKYLSELFERKRVTNIFGRYVAPQVVNEILENGEEGLKLGGLRKEISVLFVDIRGFTSMSEKVQPEEVVEILNDYLDLCAQSIFKYGGTLDKFIGDATMAIFNAPLDLDNHALMAVKTAWAMKEGSYVLQKKLEEKFGRSVQFGIGVNTGPAVVGNIGSKTRMDYTAIGDTVNTSARLESNAKPGQILLSQSTYDLVKDKIEATYLGEINVKGKTQGVSIYQLEGVKE